MANWLVTRHSGAKDWLINQGFSTDRLVSHLATSEVMSGDTVIGTLPINLVAELCAKGVRYFHLELAVPPEWRGKELSALQMEQFNANITEYTASRIPPNSVEEQAQGDSRDN